MATTIYKPERQSFGGGLGQGFGAGIIKGLEKRERQEKLMKGKAVFEAMREAAAKGGRPAALEVLGHAMDMFEDPQDLQVGFRMLDEVAPEESYQQIHGVGPDNEPTSQIVGRRDMARLSQPGGVEQVFGPGFRAGGRPTEEYEFLKPTGGPGFPGEVEQPAGFQSMGKMPLSKRPEGARTTQEVAGARAEEDQAMQRQLTQLSIDREQRLRDRDPEHAPITPNQAADNYRSDANAGRSAILAGLGSRLPDGTFSFIGDNEKKLYYQRLNLFEEMLYGEHVSKKGGAVNVSQFIKRAVDAFPGAADRPAADVPPGGGAKGKDGKKGPGFLEKANEAAGKVNKALGISSDRRKPDTKIPTVKSTADYEKLEPGQEYLDPQGNRRRKKKE